MSTVRQLQLVVVTPETTLLDQPVSSIRYPLFDGAAGIFPGRAPMVGRLGTGELSFTSADGASSYFVDGGFVQVKGSVVSILTHRAVPVAELDRAESERLLAESRAGAETAPTDFDERQKAQDRARTMLALSSR